MTMCPHPALRRGPKAVTLPVPKEHAEQVALINWFRFQFPTVLIHSLPNGAHLSGTAKRRAAQMFRLKAEGLVPGMPDLHIPSWDTWVEMKRTEGGKLSPEQRACIDHLRAMGDIVIVAKGWEDAKAQLLTVLEEAGTQ